MSEQSRRPLKWIGSSLDDLSDFPLAVRKVMGHSLHLAQLGKKALNAKPLQGFSGAGILEIFEDHDGDTYRAVYTVRFTDAVYVLHAFQKKSKSGIATPRTDIDLVKRRLKTVTDQHK